MDGDVSALDDSIERAIKEMGISKSEEAHLQKWVLNYHYGFDTLSSEKALLNVFTKGKEGLLTISGEESDVSVKYDGIVQTFANIQVVLEELVQNGTLCSSAESYSSLKKKVEDLQSEVRVYMELRDAQCTLSRNTSFLRYIDDTEFFEDIDLELESMLDNILHLIPDLL